MEPQLLESTKPVDRVSMLMKLNAESRLGEGFSKARLRSAAALSMAALSANATAMAPPSSVSASSSLHRPSSSMSLTH